MPRSFLAVSLALLTLALAPPYGSAPLLAQDSIPPSTVVVPDVAGRTVEDARDLLRAAGLNVGDLEEVRGSGTPGTVARQRPRAGATARPGDDVRLSLVRGRRAVMPAIQGLPLERARELLREAGLTPGDIVGGEAGPGAVVNGHSYHAGERVRAGEIINLSLSLPTGRVTPAPVAARTDPASPPPPIAPANPQRPPAQRPPPTTVPQRVDSAAVPDVRRLALDQARTALRAAGLTAAFDPALADSAGWTVASQLPLAGARLAAGGAVRLALAPPPIVSAPVAAAPPPAVTPPLASGLQPGGPGGSGPAGTGTPARTLPWLWIVVVLLLLAAAAAAAQRMRARWRPPPLASVSARLRAQAAPRTAVDGSPFGPPRLRLRVQAGLPSARIGTGPLFARKEVPGG
jgi:beta-lactam-binding protein with PASTA domain